METKLKVLNEEGLHARPAALLVKEANNFSSDINIIHNEKATNAKSIMGLMALGLTKDTEITLSASGDDEKEAIEKLTDLFNNKFEIQ